jgi:hypothetical protein
MTRPARQLDLRAPVAAVLLVPRRTEKGHPRQHLRRRLQHARWPDPGTVDDWSQGVPLAYI